MKDLTQEQIQEQVDLFCQRWKEGGITFKEWAMATDFLPGDLMKIKQAVEKILTPSIRSSLIGF